MVSRYNESNPMSSNQIKYDHDGAEEQFPHVLLDSDFAVYVSFLRSRSPTPLAHPGRRAKDFSAWENHFAIYFVIQSSVYYSVRASHVSVSLASLKQQDAKIQCTLPRAEIGLCMRIYPSDKKLVSIRTSTMKTAIVLASFCCASAFGLHGASTSSAVKTLGFAKSKSPMVQAIDIHNGHHHQQVRPSSMVSQ
jgi:hypothetical protein